MQINRVVVENFKRVKFADVDTSSGEVVIGGRNAQGKSSFIDAVWNTLAGKQRIVTRPIRDGESKASCEVTLGDDEGNGLVVTRTWKGDKSLLSVKPLGSKATLNQGQSVLDQIIGRFAFDPMSFVNQDAKKQLETLLDLVQIDLDLEEHEAARKGAYDRRTDVGREVKRLSGSLESMESPAANLPEEFVSVNDLIKEREETLRVSSGVSNAKTRREAIAKAIQELEDEFDALGKKVVQGTQWLNGRREPAAVEAELENAESTNAAIHAARSYRETKAELDRQEAMYEEATAWLKDHSEQKIAALSAAKFPIENLSFDEDGVLYNGVPFSQASAADKIRVSVAMAMALNPDLKVVCIKDATLLDEDNLALLRQIGKENGYQFFLEMVGQHGGETVVFEDGATV